MNLVTKKVVAVHSDSLTVNINVDNSNNHSEEPEKERAPTNTTETSSETDVSRDIDDRSEELEQVKAPISTRGISSEIVAKQGINAKLSEAVRRQLPEYRGVYTDEAVQGTKVTLTIDLGATDTIVSHHVYQGISEDKKPPVQMTGPTGSADGASLNVYGKAVMEICMGPVCLKFPCIVSDILDKVSMSIHILLCDPSDPADIVSSDQKMLFQGQSIPLTLIQGCVV